MSHSDPLRLGPLLAVDLHEPGAERESGWQALAQRLTVPALRARIDDLVGALGVAQSGADGVRIAASTEQFGLVARLVAAHLCAQASGLDLAVDAETIWWQPGPSGLVRLSVAPGGRDAPLRTGAVPLLTERVFDVAGVSRSILWGNVGSACNSTLTLLSSARPDLLPAATRIADTWLTHPRIESGRVRTGPGFRRSSCCLIYRTGTGKCEDCVLH